MLKFLKTLERTHADAEDVLEVEVTEKEAVEAIVVPLKVLEKNVLVKKAEKETILEVTTMVVTEDLKKDFS